MIQGHIKWFEDSKGYGYIEKEDGQEVFFHFTTIHQEHFKTLEAGVKVKFTALPGEKGPRAILVVKV